MSSNHKAPLAAFVVVAIACVVVLATNSMRSYARDAWRNFAAPVVSGLAFLPSEHREPAKPAVATTATDDEAIAPAGLSFKAAERRDHPVVRKVRHVAGAATKPASTAGAPSTVSTAGTVPVTPTPTTSPEPIWPAAPQHPGFGSHQGWTQGQHEHQGWGTSHASGQGQHSGWGSSHGSPLSSSYHGGSSHGHGNGYGSTSYGARSYGNEHGAPASKDTHGPSWKTTNGGYKAQGAKAPTLKKGGSWGNNGHGHGGPNHRGSRY